MTPTMQSVLITYFSPPSVRTENFPFITKVSDKAITNCDSHDILNYRPISGFSKILERLMYNRLYTCFSDFHILFYFQFGFRSKHFTDLALVHFVDHLNSSLTQKLSAVGVFRDLSKAHSTLSIIVLFFPNWTITVFEASLFNGLQTTCTTENNLPLSIKLTLIF